MSKTISDTILGPVWDPFWDLSVPLPSGARNVEDCLEEFRKEEVHF